MDFAVLPSGSKKVRLLPQHELHEGKYEDCWLMADHSRQEPV
ncbi:hypothetical protein C8P63_108113 [Melghirimyces profundicolus]|uniref:Uncharacterized protein n=1 Tax=Melghirimyces profundicolus TaxID=1242148 RepID=A0A2T6BXL9_9BACL|nr:hypothetical protein C8P63_108113 [Melghirimyces profundicolus]